MPGHYEKPRPDILYGDYSYTEGLDHYFEYARAYDENLALLRECTLGGRGSVNMLEIGVQNGCSINVWTEHWWPAQ